MVIAGSILLGRALAPLDLMINTWRDSSARAMPASGWTRCCDRAGARVANAAARAQGN
jgi:ABC-type protease/lipase transport system fused ATPase/permease subunit